MEYVTIGETAQRWGVSARLVQRLCTEGRIPGATKFSGRWAVPEDAIKPADPRKAKQTDADIDGGALVDPAAASASETSHAPAATDASATPTTRLASTCPKASDTTAAPDVAPIPMPLMNTPFPPGMAKKSIEAIADPYLRDIAQAELHYFRGEPEQAIEAALPHLESAEPALALSAHLIVAYACLPLGRIDDAHRMLMGLSRALEADAVAEMPRLRAICGCFAAIGAVLLHLPTPKGASARPGDLALLPPGLRAFGIYAQAHRLYLEGDHATSLGLAEGALAMHAAAYPIPAIYLHLICVMDCMALRRTDAAREHLLTAWNLARADDLIEAFGEHHGLLGGMLEAVIKPAWPEDFKRIIAITYRFSAGWRRVHNPEVGDDVADNLTTTEFSIAMLAARGWTNAEIAKHLGISANTVKSSVSSAMTKLGVSRRQELKRHMLA